MQFNSIDFMLFFPIVVIIYFIIPGKIRLIWLLFSSYYFYMSRDVFYALIIGGCTLITYIGGLLISHFSEDKSTDNKAKITMAVCIVINLSILIIFKYRDFFGISVILTSEYDVIHNVFNVLHIPVIKCHFESLMPIGISFYTFQTIGYMIDVYHGKVDAEKNILHFALFVSFFPQLIAGPIARSKHLLEQISNIQNIKVWDAKRFASGVIEMVWGYFMKMVIADRIALFVNTVFDNYRMFGSTELILAAIGYTIQIYCDFGSYSMLAIGASKILGFELMENFNTPYLARNIRDFWGRWHISLSTWFRDYLYIPLGGNRKGKARKAANIMIVFLISGLWHGADLSFIVWGGIHGLYQVIQDLLSGRIKLLEKKFKIKTECFSWKFLQTSITFLLVTFAWIFFRADSITDALRFCKRIIVKPTPWVLFDGGIFHLGLNQVEINILIFSIILLLLVDLVKYKKSQTIDIFLYEQNLWFEWFIVIALIVMIFIYGEYGPTFDPQQFIYFQF